MSTYSCRPNDGDSLFISCLDQFSCQGLWNALGNDGNGADLQQEKENHWYSTGQPLVRPLGGHTWEVTLCTLIQEGPTHESAGCHDLHNRLNALFRECSPPCTSEQHCIRAA